jgi:hypothetical protein
MKEFRAAVSVSLLILIASISAHLALSDDSSVGHKQIAPMAED